MIRTSLRTPTSGLEKILRTDEVFLEMQYLRRLEKAPMEGAKVTPLRMKIG